MGKVLNFTPNNQLQGYIVPFILDQGAVRGRLVRLGSAFSEIMHQHHYQHIVNRYIGEMITLGAALIMDMKTEGMMTLQITNGSAIRMIVVDINSNGDVRACATYDDNTLTELLAKTAEPTLTDLFGNGNLIFSVNFAHQNEQYQAIVELSGSTLAECMQYYFNQSDQIPTSLFVSTDTNGILANDQHSYLAGAIVLQRTPIDYSRDHDLIQQDEDDWLTHTTLLNTLTADELLSASIPTETLLLRLFHEHTVRVFPHKNIHAKCRCSRGRIHEMLFNFSEDEQESLYVDHEIQVNCEFCNQSYTFTREDLNPVHV